MAKTKKQPNSMKSTIDPEVELSERLMLEYKGPRTTWSENATAAEDFKNGVQWTTEETKVLTRDGMIPIVVNKLYPAIDFAKSYLTYNPPRWVAVGRERTDMQVANAHSELMSYIWTNSDGDLQLRQIVNDYYVKGMGAALVYVDPYADYGKGEICFQSINPLNVFIDPNSQHPYGKDAANILHYNIFTRENILRLWPDMEGPMLSGDCKKVEGDRWETAGVHVNSMSQGLGEQTKDLYHDKYEIIDRYTKVKEPRYHTYSPENEYEGIFTKEEFVAWVQTSAIIEQSENAEPRYIVNTVELTQALQVFQETGGTFHYAVDPINNPEQPQMIPGPLDVDKDMQAGLQSIPGSEIQMQQVTMGDMVKMGVISVNVTYVDRIRRVLSIGQYKRYDNVLEIEDYPIILIPSLHSGNPYPGSPVLQAKPLQQFINKIRSIIIAHASNSTSVKLLMPKGSANEKDVRKEWGRTGTGVIFYDGELGAPTISGPVPLPNELYRLEADANAAINDLFGIYPLSQGDASDAPSTYKGTVAIDEFGQRRLKNKKDDIEMGLNYIAKVVVQLIPIVYTEYKVLRIVRPNRRASQLELNKPVYDQVTNAITGILNDVTVGKYDLVIISGSTLPVNRWARFEYYMELYRNQIIDQIEVLNQTEVVDAEGVLERFNIMKDLQAQLMQATEEIKRLSGDLQTAQRESVQDRKRVEVEKFKTRLNATSDKMEAAVTVFDARLGDELNNVRKSVADEKRTNAQSANKNKRGK